MKALLKLARSSLQFRIILFSTSITIVVLVISGISFYKILSDSIEEKVGQNALELSHFLARLPIVIEILKGDEDGNDLQILYEEYLKDAKEQIFIVLIDQSGMRYIHPNRSLLGYHITGDDEKRALAGESYISSAFGVSGHTLRTFVPVLDPDTNEQIGVLAIGFYKQSLADFVKKYVGSTIFWLAIALLIGTFASIIFAKQIKKVLHGYELEEIARLFREKEAMLESLTEGIIAVDREGKITLVNNAAKSILNLPNDLIGRDMEEISRHFSIPNITEVASENKAIELLINDTAVLTRHFSILQGGEKWGHIVTFRDISEVRKVAEELTGVQQYIDGLRAKTHEFMNRLQTLSGLIELEQFDEVKKLIEKTTFEQQELIHFFSRNIAEPKISGLLLGKFQLASESNIKLSFTPGSKMGELPHHIPSDSIVLILGNLIQNSIDALQVQANGEIQVTIADQEDLLILIVEDNGKGIQLDELAIFQKGVSSKGKTRGYGLFLVKHHVESLLHGSIQFSSSKTGTVFIVEVPKKITSVKERSEIS